MKITLKAEGFDKAINFFQNLADNLRPDIEAQLKADGEFVVQTIKGHIEAQDLGWTPLSPHTVELKGGDTTIYVETGTLMNSFEVKKVSAKDFSIYIGVADKKHESGESMIDLMMWLEYGTDKMVARPLLEPTFKEVESILKEHWKELFKKEFSV